MKKQSETESNEKLDSEEIQSEQQFAKLKTKSIPAIVMLLGGAVASIVTYFNGYSLKQTLIILLICLFAFYILGVICKRVLDSFKIPIPETEEEDSEGEVIEKEVIGMENTDQVREKAE